MVHITTANNGSMNVMVTDTDPGAEATINGIIVGDGDVIGMYYDIDIDDFFKIYDNIVIEKSQRYDNIRFMITNV